MTRGGHARMGAIKIERDLGASVVLFLEAAIQNRRAITYQVNLRI